MNFAVRLPVHSYWTLIGKLLFNKVSWVWVAYLLWKCFQCRKGQKTCNVYITAVYLLPMVKQLYFDGWKWVLHHVGTVGVDGRGGGGQIVPQVTLSSVRLMKTLSLHIYVQLYPLCYVHCRLILLCALQTRYIKIFVRRELLLAQATVRVLKPSRTKSLLRCDYRRKEVHPVTYEVTIILHDF